MNIFHRKSAQEKWQKFSLIEQLANIGSEVSRAEKWQGKDENIFWNAVSRVLELFDMTLYSNKDKKALNEIVKIKELFCDAVLGSKDYGTDLKDLEKYFFNFAILIRNKI